MQIGCEEVKDDYMSLFHRLSMSCMFKQNLKYVNNAPPSAALNFPHLMPIQL